MTGELLSLRAFLSLGAVIALLVFCLWALRRGALRFPSLGGRAPILVESAASLGDRRSLAEVTIEGRRLLIGMTPAAVSLLTELAPREGAPGDGRGGTA